MILMIPYPVNIVVGVDDSVCTATFQLVRVNSEGVGGQVLRVYTHTIISQ